MTPEVSGVVRAPFQPSRRRRRTALLATATIAGAVFVIHHMTRPASVTVTPVGRGAAVDAVYATGTVEAVDRVTVKARVAGAIITLNVQEGDRVKKGDVLAVVDARPLEAELARVEAEARAADAQAAAGAPQLAVLEAQGRALAAELATARDDRDRSVNLAATGSVPPVEVERATTRVAVLEAQLAASQSQRRALRIELTARAAGSNAAVRSTAARLADAEMRAPIDGVVLSRHVEPGEVVAVNQPLLRIGEVQRLILECQIDEADVAQVSPGKRAAISLYAFPDKVFRGRVTEVLPDADRIKKSFLVKIAFDEPPAGLRSGMTAEVNVIVDERPNVLLAPVDAVDPTGAAWIIVDGRAQRRQVRTGVHDLSRVELVAGVEEGEQLVIAGGDALEQGRRVRATVQPAVAASSVLAQGQP